MSLLKIEHNCQECNNPYILAIKPSDLKSLTCCPFCGSEVNYREQDEDDEE